MKHSLAKISILSIGILLTTHPHDKDMTNNINTLHAYMWANYLQQAGKYEQAQHWYDKVLSSNPSPYAYKGYVTLLSETNKHEQLAQLIPQIDATFSQDPEMQLLCGQALYKIGKSNEADERFIRLSNQFKTDQTITFQAANIYIRRQEPENALSTIDNLLNNSPKKPNNFVFHFLKSQIYLQLNQPEKALACIKTSIEIQPRFDKGWLMFSLLLEKEGQLDEAIKGYTRYLEISGNNKEIEEHIVQLTFKQKLAQHNKTAAIINKSCFVKALTFFEQKEYTLALQHVDICLAQTPEDVESKLLKIQILSAQKEFEKAGKLLQAWIRKEPTQTMWFATLNLLCKTGLTYTQALALVEPIVKEHPTSSLPILYLADWATRAKLYDKALIYYKKALNLTHDAHLTTKLLFHISLIYYDLQQYEAMESTLEKGVALGKNFPPLLNLLAYHYATHNKKLERAQTLLNQALRHTKNPHFLDTQALIWFQKKEYTKALTLLRTIALQAPHDTSILQNLGKTYYQLGNYKEAVATIKQAENNAHRPCDKEHCEALRKTWEHTLK